MSLRYLMRKKSGITDIASHNFGRIKIDSGRIKIDSCNSLPSRKSTNFS